MAAPGRDHGENAGILALRRLHDHRPERLPNVQVHRAGSHGILYNNR